MNSSKKQKVSHFDQAKMEMIAQDYKLGTSWQHRLYKKAFYKKFNELLFESEVEVIRDIENAILENILENEEM